MGKPEDHSRGGSVVEAHQADDRIMSVPTGVNNEQGYDKAGRRATEAVRPGGLIM
jgi:hypothetical protein